MTGGRSTVATIATTLAGKRHADRPTSVDRPAEPASLARSLARDGWLWAVLGVALALRLAVWWIAPAADLLGDEREYYAAAAILADGRGFSFIDQSLWVRPPLYIVFLAALFRLVGTADLPVAAWLAQTGLSVATVALVYLLGRLWYARPAVARLAAALCAVYFPFAVYTRLLLSETLFSFLLVGSFTALTIAARRGGRWPFLVAGAALGGAVLTRGIALPFLAAIPVWLAVVHRGDRRPAWGLVARRGMLVLGVVALVVAPWTARNLVVYRAFIPVETTGGYNFWLGAQGGRDASTIVNTLAEVPNQGERQSLAYARGWEVVRADPGAYLAKSAKEFRDLWAINFSAFERLLRGFGLGRVPALWLGLTLVLDDLLYLVALPLAVLGWTRALRPEDRALLGLWIAWSCLTGAVFFAISRFRFPVMPFIMLLAARGLLELPRLRQIEWPAVPRHPRRWLVPVAVAIAVVAVVYPSFTPGLYRVGLARAATADRLEWGYELLAHGRVDESLAVFQRLPDDFYATPTALAAVYHARGEDDRALALLDDARDFPGGTLLRGDILRAQGREREAFALFNSRDIDVLNPTDLAWARLNPPALTRLDVGNGLDLGYVRGVALRERESDSTTYRWTGARAEVRLASPAVAETSVSGVARVRLKSYRPAGNPPPVTITISAGPERVSSTITPSNSWQTYDLPFRANANHGVVVVRLETATFVPGFADQRQLGAMLDWIEIMPAETRR